MSAHNHWSDTDSENGSALTDLETAVEMGIPNGEITSTDDLGDPMVSRIGGIPSFLSKSPPLDSSHCKICMSPAELLVQLWCPLQDNPYDRVLYVWGCSRRGCQKKDGRQVIRAWRALRYNEKYAKKLAKQQAKAKARTEALKQEKEKSAAPKAPVTASAFNPFATDTPSDDFGFGNLSSNPFSSTTPDATNEPSPSNPSAPPSDGGTEESEDEGGGDADSVEGLSSSFAQTALSTPWSNVPSYHPLYLDTETEYLPPAPTTSKNLKKLVDQGGGANARANANEWGHEAYEESRGVDEVFERFARRVGVRGSQCVRYDRRAAPLFYQSTDETYKSLHTIPAGTYVPVTGAHTLVSSSSKLPAYNPSSETLKRCAACRRPTTTRTTGGERVFEFQLVPHLISVLQTSSGAELGPKPSVEVKQLGGRTGEAAGSENGKEGATAKEKGLEKTGMEWGTILVFTCQDNCCAGRVDDPSAKECWQEEFVLVQWEE